MNHSPYFPDKTSYKRIFGPYYKIVERKLIPSVEPKSHPLRNTKER